MRLKIFTTFVASSFVKRSPEIFYDHDFALNFSIGYLKTGFTFNWL